MVVDKFDEGIILLWWDRWRERKPRASHYVTEIGFEYNGQLVGSCLRAQFYDWIKKKPTDLDPTRILYPEVGRLLHEGLFKRAFERSCKSVRAEIPLEVWPEGLQYPIHGKIDLVLEVEEGTYIVLEEKTTQGKGITNPKFGIRAQGPKMEHVIQLSYYKDHMSKKDKKGTTFMFMYFGRDSFYRADFDLAKHKFDWNRGYERFKTLETALRTKKMPSPDYDKKEYPCSWCLWQTACIRQDKKK